MSLAPSMCIQTTITEAALVDPNTSFIHADIAQFLMERAQGVLPVVKQEVAVAKLTTNVYIGKVESSPDLRGTRLPMSRLVQQS